MYLYVKCVTSSLPGNPIYNLTDSTASEVLDNHKSDLTSFGIETSDDELHGINQMWILSKELLAHLKSQTISKQEDILSAIESFYKQLYSSKDISLDDVDLNTVIEKDEVNILKEDMSSELEGKLTYQEASFALKNMKN